MMSRIKRKNRDEYLGNVERRQGRKSKREKEGVEKGKKKEKCKEIVDMGMGSLRRGPAMEREMENRQGLKKEDSWKKRIIKKKKKRKKKIGE